MTGIPFLLLTLASAGAAPQGVLIDFMSQNCGPCREMSPIVAELHQQGYPVRKVDIDQDPETAQRFGINRIPCFVLLINGREANRIVGLTTEGQLKRLLSQIPTEPVEAAVDPNNSLTTPKPAAKAKPATPKSIPIDTVDNAPKRSLFSLPFTNGKAKQDGVVKVEPATPRGADVRANNDNPAAQPEQLADGPIASSVRIRVKDATGTNFGSGTIIASKAGRAYVLACGHIFRDVDKAVTVDVDVFSGKKLQTYPGKVIKYDLTAEVGVVSIEPENVVPVCKIASLERPSARGDHVFSVGCGGGEPPSIERLEIKGLNLYRGPDTIECTGVPAQGRSGGGLFNNEGHVIGVCFAADPDHGHGIYAGLKPILKLLDEADLSAIYRNETTSPGAANAQLASAENQTERSDSGLRKTVAREENGLDGAVAGRLADAERAAEIQAASENAEEAEVVCIIRPLNKSQEASRVVIINRASSRFVSYLQGEMRSQPRQTMARQPAKDAEKDLDAVKADDANPDRPTSTVETRQANRPASMPVLRAETLVDRPYRRSAASR